VRRTRRACTWIISRIHFYAESYVTKYSYHARTDEPIAETAGVASSDHTESQIYRISLTRFINTCPANTDTRAHTNDADIGMRFRGVQITKYTSKNPRFLNIHVYTNWKFRCIYFMSSFNLTARNSTREPFAFQNRTLFAIAFIQQPNCEPPIAIQGLKSRGLFVKLRTIVYWLPRNDVTCSLD